MEDLKPTPPTQEEIEKYEAEMTTFFNDKLPFLRLKAEYDTLNAEIAESRIRTIQANHMFMKMKMDESDARKDAEETNKTSEDGNKS